MRKDESPGLQLDADAFAAGVRARINGAAGINALEPDPMSLCDYVDVEIGEMTAANPEKSRV